MFEQLERPQGLEVMPPQVLADFLHPVTWVRNNDDDDDDDDDSRWLLPG